MGRWGQTLEKRHVETERSSRGSRAGLVSLSPSLSVGRVKLPIERAARGKQLLPQPLQQRPHNNNNNNTNCSVSQRFPLCQEQAEEQQGQEGRAGQGSVLRPGLAYVVAYKSALCAARKLSWQKLLKYGWSEKVRSEANEADVHKWLMVNPSPPPFHPSPSTKHFCVISQLGQKLEEALPINRASCTLMAIFQHSHTLFGKCCTTLAPTGPNWLQLQMKCKEQIVPGRGNGRGTLKNCKRNENVFKLSIAEEQQHEMSQFT